ncbi:hypothetical protein [Campylobacter hyointestinalis]|uniref:hypothetical protein n=1 Tax=Campylobacter hyointestinalis TaxID=198 RepID=UPI000CE355FA|nr:hypothetical protein [Campylobacter hyointestinalis]PPB52930.1 hypothetical protein CDQ67_09335 [Campylobacter hyointestinalis subsp. hyointestinalis]
MYNPNQSLVGNIVYSNPMYGYDYTPASYSNGLVTMTRSNANTKSSNNTSWYNQAKNSIGNSLSNFNSYMFGNSGISNGIEYLPTYEYNKLFDSKFADVQKMTQGASLADQRQLTRDLLTSEGIGKQSNGLLGNGTFNNALGLGNLALSGLQAFQNYRMNKEAIKNMKINREIALENQAYLRAERDRLNNYRGSVTKSYNR